MKSKRKKILAICLLIFGIIVIGLGVYSLFFQRNADSEIDSDNNTNNYISSSEKDYATKFTIDPSFYDDLPLLKNYKGKIPLSEEWEGYTIKTELKYGKMNGFTELYDKQGHIREQMTLIDDKRNGEYSKWDKEGELLHKGNFKNDKR